jgi:hypothetical protein
MKRNLLLFAVTLVCLSEVCFGQQVQSNVSSWQPLFEFQKNQFTQSGGVTPFVTTVDTFNSSKKVAFYGNFNKTYKVESNGSKTLLSDSPNTIISDGHNAGYVAFDPNFSWSTILSHCVYDGTDYIGTFKSDSFNVASSPIMYLKNGIYVPETSIKFDGKVAMYPLGNNKFFITGAYYYGWDKNGQKPLYSSSIWDKTNGTLTGMGGIGDYVQHIDVSNKDGTIAVVTGSNYDYNLRVIWYGQEVFMDDLYPGTPPNGHLTNICVVDKQTMYSVWSPFGDTHLDKLMRLDFATKTWVPIATTNGTIAGITGDDKDNLYICGAYTTINGATVGSHSTRYQISTNTFTDLPQLPAIQHWELTQLMYRGGGLYLFDESRLLFSKETVYILSGVNALPLVLTTFKGQSVSKANQLMWTTESESNTNHFEIERSTDGTTFGSIGRVSASGTTSLKTNYTFADNTPPIGTNFYRLKMTDKDGQFTYSQTIALATATVSPIGFRFYPNPARDMLTVEPFQSNNATVRVLSTTGQIIVSKKGATIVTLDIHQLQPGTYTVQIITSGGTESKKFVKL